MIHRSRAITGLVAAAAALLLAGCLDLDDDTSTRDDEGAIVEGGEVAAFSIKVGDCIGNDLGAEFTSVDGVPCSEPHVYEVYHTFQLTSEDDAYPGDAAIGEQASQGCLDAFEGFVGVAYGTSIYDFFPLTPTPESWEQGDDREALCVISNLDGSTKTGSAAGTAT